MAWWLNPVMGDCTEQANTTGCSKPLLAMDLKFPISIVWQEFDHDLGLVLSLSSISRSHPCVAPWFLISFSSYYFHNIIRVDRFDLKHVRSHAIYFLHKFYHCKVIRRRRSFPVPAEITYEYANIPLYGTYVVYWLSHWLNWYHGIT